MKEIKLSKGKIAMVDDQDYEILKGFTWFAFTNGYTFYAQRRMKQHPTKRMLMHREIMAPPSIMEVDHIDGNGLNNQRSNLRVVSHRQNLQNIHGKKSSEYVGVCFTTYSKKNPWVAGIRLNGKSKYLGRYPTEKEASDAYQLELIKIAT